MKDLIETAASNPEVIGGGIFGGFGAWLFLKKFLVRSAIETTNLSAADGYSDVIQTLRDEVKRLGEANADLAVMLNQIQLENIALKNELAKMQQLVARLERKLTSEED